MREVKVQFGGSFAPKITAEDLVDYKNVAASCPDRRCADYMKELIKMLEVFNQTPASTEKGKAHSSGAGIVIPLEEKEIERIWDYVPYKEECDVMGNCFDSLQGSERKAAYHLLWYARELTLDREPITKDQL